MNEPTYDNLRKTLFWQRWAMIALTVFLGILSFAYFYSLYTENFYSISGEDIYFFVVSGCYLVAGFYLDYILYKSWSVLKRCLEAQDMTLLEIVFKKQRHFWMGISIMILSAFILLLATIVLLIFLYQ